MDAVAEEAAVADRDACCWGELTGGLAAPTSWPLQRGQALDVWFNRGDDMNTGVFKPGYYRGIIDKVAAPTKTGIQTAQVDFVDDDTRATVDLRRDQLYKPSEAPTSPTVEQGEVAVEVTADQLPGTDDTDQAFGLTTEQLAALKQIWYEDGHYSGGTRLWELLRRRAEAEGKPAFYGIRQRQMRAWLRSQEANQLFRIPKAPKTYRSFNTPSAPLRYLQMDSIDLGAYGGLQGAKQKWVQVIVDPATRYVAASMHGGKSVDSRYTIENVVNMITSLRDGPLKYDEEHKGNVFKPDGTLVNQLRLATDSGSEFKVKGGSFGDRLYAKLSAAGLMNDRSMLIHSYNLASAPSQAAYVERMNSTIRQKLRLAVQAEQGTIQRSRATAQRQKVGWKPLLARAIRAINEEVSVGKAKTPNEAMADWVSNGPRLKEDSEPRTEDEEKALKAKAQLARQKMLTEGSRARVVSLSRQKAELAGKRKMETRWSEEIFVVDKVLKRGADTLNVAYEYKLRRTNGQPKTGKYKREQLQLIPKLTIEWHGRAIKGKWAELAQAGVVPKKGVRDGSSRAERVIDEIPAAQRGGLGYEQLLGRLVQYLRSGMELEDATARLRESLMPDGEQGANPGRLAVLGKE